MQEAEVVDYKASLTFDPTKPDGAPRKLLDTSRLDRLGWRSNRTLKGGIISTYKDAMRSKLFS